MPRETQVGEKPLFEFSFGGFRDAREWEERARTEPTRFAFYSGSRRRALQKKESSARTRAQTDIPSPAQPHPRAFKTQCEYERQVFQSEID